MTRIKILTIVFGIIVVGCFASTRPSKSRPDPDGFRDIRWGTEISTLKDLEKVEQDKSSDSDLAWYTRKGDTLAIGEANFDAFKKELLEQFGKALEPERSMKKTGKRAGRDAFQMNQGKSSWTMTNHFKTFFRAM